MTQAVVVQSSEALTDIENTFKNSPIRKTRNQIKGIGLSSGFLHWKEEQRKWIRN